jgi:hypothetical protein
METKFKYRLLFAWVILLFQGAFWTGCSHTPKGRNLAPLDPSASDSGVEIEYVLGRDHYRFEALAQGDLVTATSTINRRVLDQGPINSGRYPDFLQKASEFIQQIQRAPAQQLVCRTPFVVTVRIQTETQMVKGCRSADNGALSRLVRDGEFLLYSKN